MGAHQECVPCRTGTQSTSCQTAYCLVNIKQGDVGVLGTLTQPMSCLPSPSSVRVVDEYLDSLTGIELWGFNKNILFKNIHGTLTLPACVAAVRHG